MSAIFSALVTIAWGLWFGGVMALFLFVTQLSATFGQTRHEMFSLAASATFAMFEKYQLIVGAVALVAAVGWRIVEPGLSRGPLFWLLSLAALAAVTESTLITPKIEAIRWEWAAHQNDNTPAQLLDSQMRFKRLHGAAMGVYTTEAALLLIAGVLLTRSMRPKVAPSSAAAT